MEQAFAKIPEDAAALLCVERGITRCISYAETHWGLRKIPKKKSCIVRNNRK